MRPVDPAVFRAHAANLDAVRGLLAEVRAAGEQLGRDEAAFGPVCGWILTSLDERRQRHQEHLACIEQSLLVMVEGLYCVADGTREWKVVIHRDDAVATRDGTPVIDGPTHSLQGLMDSVIRRVQDREWVEPELADGAPVAEFAAPVDEITAAVRAAGLQCAMTCVEPLRRLLDDLTGTPRVVAAHTALWQTIGTDLLQLNVFLRDCLQQDMPRRDRLDVRSYLALMAYNVEGLIGCGELALAMGVIVKAAGDLILLTPDIVRGVIADLFAHVIVWAVDTSTLASRQEMAVRLGSVVATAWRIDAYLTALTDRIITLSLTVDG